MASAKDLRKRLTSVKNTEQITRAMKMVSAAKLRRAQDAILALRPYAHEVAAVIATLARTVEGTDAHPLLAKGQPNERKSLVILVTSDRGLCGAFNSNIIKTAQRFLRDHGSEYEKLDFAFVGKKGFEFFRNKKTGKYYADFFKGMNYLRAKSLGSELIDLFLSGEYTEIKFVYNEFKTAISQKIVVENFLPVESTGEKFSSNDSESVMTIYEPNIAGVLDALLDKHFAIHVYRVMLESLASEHGARMAAMENATKNAGEMIRKIGLLYNKTRQAGITKELLEIVSGTEAQKG